MTKTQMVQKILESDSNLNKKTISAVIDSMVDVAVAALRKGDDVTIPGLAKFRVVKKPATKERMGVNPFTGEECLIAAKPARKVIKVRAAKYARDAVA